jgi:predicted O-methyltransferase YrrM
MMTRMIKFLSRIASPLVSRSTQTRITMKVLRTLSSEWRAYTDVFVPPYDTWMDWHSGLGDGIYALYGLARSLKPNTIVEIGSARGRSTCALALACRQNKQGKVYAIDPHTVNAWTDARAGATTLTFLRDRLGAYELEEWCEVLAATTAEAAQGWSRPVDLLFVDGDHTYDGVRKDFDTFSPWLTDHALVVFHDTVWDHHRDSPWYRPNIGVPQFMHELQERGYPSITVPEFPGLTILRPSAETFRFVLHDMPPLKATVE